MVSSNSSQKILTLKQKLGGTIPPKDESNSKHHRLSLVNAVISTNDFQVTCCVNYNCVLLRNVYLPGIALVLNQVALVQC